MNRRLARCLRIEIAGVEHGLGYERSDRLAWEKRNGKASKKERMKRKESRRGHRS